MVFKLLKTSFLGGPRRLRGAKPAESDLLLLAPLAESLELERPEPGLLEGIEAELGMDQAKPTDIAKKWRGIARLALVFAIGGWMTLNMIGGSRGDLEISIRSEVGEAWSSLGAVTLRGAALRSFVAARCEGHTHLAIALRGGQRSEEPGETTRDVYRPLASSDEKILMTCNF